MEGKTISLSSLKSGNAGKNIDGGELRDFGNGKKEFDPTANGFFAKPEEERKSDREAALELFDKQIEERNREAHEFNELLDKYDGIMTEEEYLQATGKSFISDMLNDHTSEEEKKEIEAIRAENRKKKEEEEIQKVVQFENKEDNDFYDEDDMDDLEKEILAEEDNTMPVIPKSNEVVGEFDPSTIRKDNPLQPQVVPDRFIDPNLSRKHEASEKVKVDEDDLEKEILTETSDEEEEVENVVMGTAKVDTLPTPTVPTKADDSVTGNITFEVPEQKKQTFDETGMSEEERDLAELDEDSPISVDDDDDDTDVYWKKIGTEYAKKVKPVIKKLDLNAAIVSSEPVTVNTIVNNNTAINHYFKWVLINSGRPFTLKSFTASELNTLGTMAGAAARAKDIIKIIWDHMIEGAGNNFDVWCKTTSHKDLTHLWFGVYGSCFGGANHIPYVCPKCNRATVSTDISIERMVEYVSPEVETKVKSILAMNEDPDMGKKMPVTRVQISDTLVIDFKDPSVYDVLTTSMLDNETRQKYAEGSAMLPYIANIYFIDQVNGGITLRPLANKVYQGNEIKTLKRRAIEYSMIIRSLSSEQYRLVSDYISKMTDADDGIKYIYPEATCDYCHETIPKIETNPSEMVFTRHRLALMEG